MDQYPNENAAQVDARAEGFDPRYMRDFHEEYSARIPKEDHSRVCQAWKRRHPNANVFGTAHSHAIS